MNLERDDRQILTVDIGAGTQDIYIYDPKRPPENNVQFILPSPVAMAAETSSSPAASWAAGR